ncbi:hypothetical protein [Saccharothrix sp. NRRL B-16314]|uniref:hypothetical protein n=1 Tax=Saccharothrix sp. NRRL B-16314 TaxID=1463825 RepID=UPI001E3E9C0A|nr:hypothetical protein [Saccharothrix sp. NRRL B-16314]
MSSGDLRALYRQAADGPPRSGGKLMGSMVVIRYETRAEVADENERLVRQVFAELDEGRPDGLRYATFRLADGVTFVHLAVTEGETSPLVELPAFKEFQEAIGERLVDGVDRSAATLVGSYRLLTA